MKTPYLSAALLGRFLASEKAKKSALFLLVSGLIFFAFWLASYSRTIIITPYPAEYREGAILLFTDSLLHKMNPFSLSYHPLMTNNYGFFYNLVVLPFAIMFGNTLAVHRTISILFIVASSILIIVVLFKVGNTLPFASAGGLLVLASLLFAVTPLARSDSTGEFFFLVTVLLPWYRKFDRLALSVSVLTGLLAFLAKPYFLLSVGIVSLYIFIFISKGKGLLYALAVVGSLFTMLYVINIFLECYFLDVILNNMANSSLSNSHMLKQLTLFVKTFLPCSLIISLVLRTKTVQGSARSAVSAGRQSLLDLTNLNEPVTFFSVDYFWFFFGCTFLAVVSLLGRHSGAYMTYFFQLVTPGLILVIFQYRDVLYAHAVMTVPLILINFFLICFWVLYPNKLSAFQRMEWDKLYRYIASSNHILNSPVLIPEMIRLGMEPVDSGQSEYYFKTKPYTFTLLAPQYDKVNAQGKRYLNRIRLRVKNRKYDYIIVTSEPSWSPFAGYSLIDQFYDQVDLIHVAMPQTGQYWTIEVNEPKSK